MRKILILILICTLFFINNVSAKEITISLTNIRYSSNSINITDSYTGSWRISFELACYETIDNCADFPAWGIIRKNSSQYGNKQYQYSKNVYTTYYQNFTSINENIYSIYTIYCEPTGDGSTCSINNLKIYFDDTGTIYYPDVPNNITAIQLNISINTTWIKNETNYKTDKFNISLNGVWNNSTNNTYSLCSIDNYLWCNVSVSSYNQTSNRISNTSINLSTKFNFSEYLLSNCESSDNSIITFSSLFDDEIILKSKNMVINPNNYKIILKDNVNDIIKDSTNIYFYTNNNFFIANKTNGTILYEYNIKTIEMSQTLNYVLIKTDFFNLYKINKLNGSIENKFIFNELFNIF